MVLLRRGAIGRGSIRAGPGVGPGPGDDMGMREEVESSWDNSWCSWLVEAQGVELLDAGRLWVSLSCVSVSMCVV